MKKNIIILGSLICFSFVQSCSSKLDITPPNNITDEQIQDLMENGSDETKLKIMNGIAAPMISYLNFSGVNGAGAADPRYYTLQGLDWMRNLEANDVVLGYDTNTDELRGKQEYEFSVDFRSVNSDKNRAYWYCAAFGINKANLLLGYMTKEAAAASNSFRDGRARGLIVRAFEYMSLMESYQDAYTRGGSSKLGMSLYETYNPLQGVKARSSAKETYDFIIADLTEAVSLLKAAGIGYTSTSLEDFDLGVANFLLARAYLWSGDYADCITTCQDIISNSGLSLIKEEYYGGHNTGTSWKNTDIKVLPLTNAFLNVRSNTECILGFIRTSSYLYTPALNIATNPFGTDGPRNSFARIDDQLYNKIADADFRKDQFLANVEIGDYTIAASSSTSWIPKYVSLKFANTVGLADDGKSNTTAAYVARVEFCKFRLAEVYLMLAEAQAMNGSDSGAKSTLDILLKARTRSGATALTCDNYPSMTGMTTLQKIQLQWRIEMWGEGGREFYNNKRWGIDVNRTGSTVHVAKITWSADKLTCEIPQQEIETNPLCEQNDIK